MDDVTKAIRHQYEQFPYPVGAPAIRAATDAKPLLGYSEKSCGDSGAIRALDAGCGCGVGLVGCALLQPDVEFLGIDISRVGLRELDGQAKARALENLRVQEVDLMTIEGLDVPEGGFDVIYSSGVLHHLSDAAGIDTTAFAVNPEISFFVETRVVRKERRIESISYQRVGDDEPILCTDSVQAKAPTILWDQSRPFTGESFMNVMGQEGVGPEDTRGILLDLARQELLYRPHLCDV